MTAESNTKRSCNGQYYQNGIGLLLLSVLLLQFIFIHNATLELDGVLTSAQNLIQNPDEIMEYIKVNKQKKNDEHLYNIRKSHKPNQKIKTSKMMSKFNRTNPIENVLAMIESDFESDMVLKDLPSHTDYTNLYGNDIVIEGLETCEAFRTAVPLKKRHIGPAGIFNTGTNLLAKTLKRNCVLKNFEKKTGIRFQVPWGKHSPAKFRLHNVAEVDGKEIVQTDVLPVVTIKDPYTWMANMCRHPYTATWRHDPAHCPNLMPNEVDTELFQNLDPNHPIPLTVRHGVKNKEQHKSLLHLWNNYYKEYDDVKKYPRLIVRFEDFLLYPQEVATKVCNCAGGYISDPKNFVIPTEISAEGEAETREGKGAKGLIEALQQYGNAEIRRSAFTFSKDLDFAKEHLNKNLMEKYHYSYMNE